MVFCLGMNLALRSGKEHRSLRPDMFKIVEPPNGNAYLLYVELGSKNNLGGLKETNKSVKIFANSSDPGRSLQPSDAPDAFYLQPLCKPSYNCWYQAKPVGHNPLSGTVKRLCNGIGVQGNYTNHSL